MSPENNTPTPVTPEIGLPPAGPAKLELVPPLPELITVPEAIQTQIDQQHAENGTVPSEAFVPSREPVPLERQSIPLTDAQVASMSEAGAVKAAELGGAEPSDALETREAAIQREEVAAAQRLVENPPVITPPESTNG